MSWMDFLDLANSPTEQLKNPAHWIGIAMVGATIFLSLFEIVIRKLKALVGAV